MTITFVANVFNTLNSDDVDFPKETIDLILKKTLENLEQVQQTTQDSALAISLYTDFSSNNNEEVLYTRYLEVLGQINLKTEMMNILNQEDNPKNDELSDRLIDEQLVLITDLVSISDNLKNLYTRITIHLREEVRKYDV